MMRSTRETKERSAVRGEPTQDEVRKRAFEIYVRRGRQPGREKDDWAQAERELREERQGAR